jgi:hypothetical protein
MCGFPVQKLGAWGCHMIVFFSIALYCSIHGIIFVLSLFSLLADFRQTTRDSPLPLDSNFNHILFLVAVASTRKGFRPELSGRVLENIQNYLNTIFRGRGKLIFE